MKLKISYLLSINESGKSYPNLSRNEWEDVHSLTNNHEIVIKLADKESAIAVRSKKYNLMEA